MAHAFETTSIPYIHRVDMLSLAAMPFSHHALRLAGEDLGQGAAAMILCWAAASPQASGISIRMQAGPRRM